MINFKKDLTAAEVERKGQKGYKLGKIFMLVGLCGFVLLLLIVGIGEVMDPGANDGIEALFFDVPNDLSFVLPLIALAYIGVLLGIIGIGLYNIGINRFALGRIAVNTEKEDSLSKTTSTTEELPEL